MDKKLELLLVKKFPDIFREYGLPMEQSCMAFGLECGAGWFQSIYKACIKIQKICTKYDIKVVAKQIKEKFGELRFYYSITEKYPNKIDILDLYLSRKANKYKLGEYYNLFRDFRKKFYKTPSEKIRDIINDAEREANKICEVCGDKGKLCGNGWVQTLCDECYRRIDV